MIRKSYATAASQSYSSHPNHNEIKSGIPKQIPAQSNYTQSKEYTQQAFQNSFNMDEMNNILKSSLDKFRDEMITAFTSQISQLSAQVQSNATHINNLYQIIYGQNGE